MIFDTHAHYDDDAFDEDRDTLLGEIFSSGICCITDVGASVKSSKSAVALSKKWPQIYAAVGVHPDSTADMTEEDIETLRSLAQEKKVVAIGEIGLDYYWDNSPREVQKKWFERQLELASALTRGGSKQYGGRKLKKLKSEKKDKDETEGRNRSNHDEYCFWHYIVEYNCN